MEELVEIANKFDIEILTPRYIDARTPMELRCKKCGYIWFKTPKTMKDNYEPWKGCPNCREMRRKKKYYNKYVSIANKRNIEILTPLNEYETAKTKLNLRCKICGHEWSVRATDMVEYDSHKWGGCISCRSRNSYWEKRSEESKKQVLFRCISIAERHEIEILSNNYENASTPLNYRCYLCDFEWSAEPRHSVFADNWEGCPNCKEIEYFNNLRNIGKRKYSKLITEIREYKDVTSDLEWECLLCGNHFFKSADLMKRRTNLGCPKCYAKTTGYIRESFCRCMLEEILGVYFEIHKRFEWLVGINCCGLHLDGYNSDLSLGFEHNGEQHYYYITYFHNSEEDFKNLQQNDRLKINLCKSKGIDLIIIPYFKEFYEIEQYIKEELDHFGITYNQCDHDWKRILKKARMNAYKAFNKFKNIDSFDFS